MGKTIHVVNNAAGVILKASKDRAVCEAYIAGRMGSAGHIMEHVTTPENDPAVLYKVADASEPPQYLPTYALTTLRLT